jgi:regulator of sirC expression with transglutaminase-like and TPR domain
LLKSYLNAVPNAPDAEIVRRQLGEIEKSATTK